MEDQKILALYFERNEDAIRRTEEKFGGLCSRIAMNILSVREDAEECVNDTYHAAWSRIPPERPASLGAYLGRITRNLAISRYRKLHAEKRFSGMEIMLSELGECIPSDDDLQKNLEGKELSGIITGWLRRLPKDDRILFVRRYWYGDPLKDLAAKYGCTQQQMAQRMLRLRRNLKKQLEKEEITL